MMKRTSSCPCYRCASDRGEDFPIGEIPEVTMPKVVNAIDAWQAERAELYRYIDSLKAAGNQINDDLGQLTDHMRQAIGYYSCPCGSQFEFTEHSAILDYAALNRWLGRHNDDCKDRLLLELAEADAGLAALRAKIDATCRQRDDANMKVSAMRMAP